MHQKSIILVLLLTISIGLQAQEKKINKSFDGIKEISLNTASGDCHIIKGSGTKVDVSLVYSYSDDVYEAIFEQKGEKLVMKEKFTKNSTSNGSSDWKLMVPEGIELNFNTGSGDLDINSLAIEIKSNSGSGDVSLDKTTGTVKVNTGSGDINALTFDGILTINAGSGGVDLSNSKGTFAVNLGSGDIEAKKLDGKFSMNVGSGDINASNLSLTAASSFNSGSGNASVILNSALKNDISINSGSGNAILDFNGLAIAGEVTMKANKRHGDISAPFKFDNETEEGQGDQTILKKTAKIGNSEVKINIATGSGRAVIEK